MTTIEKQLDLERVMVQRGVTAYEAQIEQARAKGREAQTAPARRLTQEYLLPLGDKLKVYLANSNAGQYGKYRVLMRKCDPNTLMFFALQSIFNSFTYTTTIQSIAATIGRMVEDEIRFTVFQSSYGDYYKAIQDDFKRKGTKDYRYIHRVLTHKANEKEDGWQDWSPNERIHIGMKLIDIVLTNTDLIEKVYTVSPTRANFRKTISIVPTKAAQEWVEQHHEAAKLLNPDSMPCIIPPDPWTTRKQGGYYTPQMRQRNPLIKTTNRLHRKIVDGTDISMIIDAVNFVQKTAWQINANILPTVREIWSKNLPIGMPHSQKYEVPESPFTGRKKEDLSEQDKAALLDWKREAAEIYRMEKDRIAKAFQTTRIIRMANEFSEYDKFWFVWYADFRGRMYASTNSFSPQGPDIAKALLQFGEGKRLGARGWFWLKVHVANKFGNDKVDFADREKWTVENHDMLTTIAADPIANAKLWADADKPWQFLAAVMEYVNASNYALVGGSPEDFISHLPIGQDGSCNGLQHFSAMLRDPVGGRATNLIPQELPADIYTQVGTVFKDKLITSTLTAWKPFVEKYGVPRYMPKRPVMTLPYGSTQRSCTGYIYDAIVKTDKKIFSRPFRSAMDATPLMWKSIGEVVIAAREIMDWLQTCASKISKKGLPVLWTTPDGFHVFQGNYDIESYKIKTQLQGEYCMRVGVITDRISNRKQRQAISPNFVHSMDSSHLRRVIKEMATNGLKDIAAIHDDYGTHACDTDALRDIIRTSFANMYIEHDPVGKFYADQVARRVKLPAPPKRGTLDLELVKKSEYFFG